MIDGIIDLVFIKRQAINKCAKHLFSTFINFFSILREKSDFVAVFLLKVLKDIFCDSLKLFFYKYNETSNQLFFILIFTLGSVMTWFDNSPCCPTVTVSSLIFSMSWNPSGEDQVAHRFIKPEEASRLAVFTNRFLGEMF